jgi:hypothetical protein
MSAQEGQSGAVNKTSVESTTQDDDFRGIKRCKRHTSNDTSQTAKKTTKQILTKVALKLSPKAVLTRNFFAPLRTTDMDMETTGAEKALPAQEAPRKPFRRETHLYAVNLLLKNEFEISAPHCPTHYSPTGNDGMLDIVAYKNVRLSEIIVSDVLDSDHLPVVLNLLEHIRTRNL